MKFVNAAKKFYTSAKTSLVTVGTGVVATLGSLSANADDAYSIDPTAIVTQITDLATPIMAIGLAFLGVVVAIKGLKAVRRSA